MGTKLYILEKLKMEIKKVLESCFMKMEILIKDNGKMVSLKE